MFGYPAGSNTLNFPDILLTRKPTYNGTHCNVVQDDDTESDDFRACVYSLKNYNFPSRYQVIKNTNTSAEK